MTRMTAWLVAVAAALGPMVSSIARGDQDAERQRADTAREATKSIDKDAMAAIEETRKAADDIAAGKTSEALAAIERATGKVDILVARKPASALIPVEVAVEILDPAPNDPKDIEKLARQAANELEEREYAKARRTLEGLASEIRLRTYHLPLATYPGAMRRAARLLEEKKSKEAAEVLRLALDTLVVVEQRTPLPLLMAETAVDQARAQRESSRETARKRLAAAKDELERARHLGYVGDAREYDSLKQSIAQLDKQLAGTENTDSAFASLKSRLSELVDRLSHAARGIQRSSETQPQ
jgi:hypothetical protein